MTPMLQIPHIPLRPGMIRPNLRPLRLNTSRQAIARPGQHLARHAHVAGAPRQVGGIVSGQDGGGLCEALVVELGVFGSLVRTWDGGDGVLGAGVVGDGGARGGHFGEGASLVGVGHFVSFMLLLFLLRDGLWQYNTEGVVCMYSV